MNIKQLTSLALVTVALGASASAADKRPNILFIITDDQDATTLDVFGDTQCDTPNLDRMAKQGLAITGAHQMGSYTATVSAASRTMIMTGTNIWRAQPIAQKSKGLYKDKPNQFGLADSIDPNSPEASSIPMLFHKAGYDTYRTCKSGNSYEPANVLFDERHDKTCREGNDAEGSKWHADNVIQYLKKRDAQKGDKSPFMIYMGFSHPHDPRHGTPELLAKYGAEDVKEPTKINAKTPRLPLNWLPEKPFYDGNAKCRDEEKVMGVMTRRDEITIRNELGKEYACIENVDTHIGRVLKELERIGELDNTYIFFTADHGIAVGKHAQMGKQSLYEHTFRVPFLVMGPDVPKNKVTTGNIYLSDVLATLCDLADIDIPASTTGESFKSVIKGERESIREVVYGAYSGGDKPGIRVLKQGDWKLIKSNFEGAGVQKTQLFNLKDNPMELTTEHHAADVVTKIGNKPKANQIDLSQEPRYKAKLAELEALLLEEMIKVNDPYRLWDQPQQPSKKTKR